MLFRSIKGVPLATPSAATAVSRRTVAEGCDTTRGPWDERHPRGGRPMRAEWAQLAPAVQFFRSTLLPAAIVLLFALALVAVSARIWLPGDMAGPAPLS